jgi:hypothetical protein
MRKDCSFGAALLTGFVLVWSYRADICYLFSKLHESSRYHWRNNRSEWRSEARTEERSDELEDGVLGNPNDTC